MYDEQRPTKRNPSIVWSTCCVCLLIFVPTVPYTNECVLAAMNFSVLRAPCCVLTNPSRGTFFWRASYLLPKYLRRKNLVLRVPDAVSSVEHLLHHFSFLASGRGFEDVWTNTTRVCTIACGERGDVQWSNRRRGYVYVYMCVFTSSFAWICI